jgi:hypothetical protein
MDEPAATNVNAATTPIANNNLYRMLIAELRFAKKPAGFSDFLVAWAGSPSWVSPASLASFARRDLPPKIELMLPAS